LTTPRSNLKKGEIFHINNENLHLFPDHQPEIIIAAAPSSANAAAPVHRRFDSDKNGGRLLPDCAHSAQRAGKQRW
jgi:hypothetical protein